MNNIEEIIKEMQEQVSLSVKCNDPLDEASWGSEIGVLLSTNEALIIIQALQSAPKWLKYPENVPKEDKEYPVRVEPKVGKARFEIREFWTFYNQFADDSNITHFMEIPEINNTNQ